MLPAATGKYRILPVGLPGSIGNCSIYECALPDLELNSWLVHSVQPTHGGTTRSSIALTSNTAFLLRAMTFVGPPRTNQGVMPLDREQLNPGVPNHELKASQT
jgi:hypothetical protein